MQREGVIQQVFEATFPTGTTAAEFVDFFKRPSEALVRNYFNESFRVIGNVPMSGEIRPTAFTESTVIPGTELIQPLMGDSISFISSLLDDFIREKLAPIENVVFANPTVSGVSVTQVGSDLEIEVVVIASSGTAFDNTPELPPQFFDPSGVQPLDEQQNINAGVSLDFTPASGNAFVMQHDLCTERFTWNMWTTETTPNCIVNPQNVVASGKNHVLVELDVPMSGYLNMIGIGI